jgi:thiamine pyrophosphate-dependent acetolactate synthase large subunit-like protein
MTDDQSRQDATSNDTDYSLSIEEALDFPYRNFYPANAKIIQIDIRAEALGRRTPIDLG